MKTPHWLTRPNSALSYLRIAIAGALVTTAVGMAFIAAKTSSPSAADLQALLQPQKVDRDALLQVSKWGDPDKRVGANAEARAGIPNEYRSPGYTPEIEQYIFERAYPADSLNPDASYNARQAWLSMKQPSTVLRKIPMRKGSTSAGSTSSGSTSSKGSTSSTSSSAGKQSSLGGAAEFDASVFSDPPGVWTPIGPSAGTYPAILNILGDSKDYVASGRVTGLAIGPNCKATGCSNLDQINAAKCFEAPCTLYLAAAGGGIWKTNNAFSPHPLWSFISGSFGTNAIGSILVDPTDPSGNTIYVGTGEPNASSDSEAGVGVYKSTNGGASWALFTGTDIFFQRSIGQMAIDNTGNLLVPIASGVRGIDETYGGASSSAATGHPLPSRGLYRCNGVACTQIFVAPAPTRGCTTVRVDPTHAGIIYVNAFGGGAPGGTGGIWRSVDNGVSFSQIFAPRDGSGCSFANAIERDEFDVVTILGGATRMYVGAGPLPACAGVLSSFWRSDNVDTAATFATFGAPYTTDYCTGQCWYDNVVYAPSPQYPGTVYLLGSFSYSQIHGKSNGRSVLISGNAGTFWSDWTFDAGVPHSEWTHPDNHAIVANPNNPFQYWEGNDGGCVRSNGEFGNIASRCDTRGLSAADTSFCKTLLSLVPQQLTSINAGLSTFQFHSLSIIPGGSKIQGGTQDDGTFQFTGSASVWPQEIYGDGAQSGFAKANSAFRFNTFFGQAHDVNFRDGDPRFWCVASAPILSSPEGSFFAPPIIADPTVGFGQTIFQGSFSVWRTQDWAGTQLQLESNCNEFTTSAVQPGCGDFVIIGNGVPSTRLTSAAWGGRSGSAVSVLKRETTNPNELWAATGAGRVFVTDNANAAAGSVIWYRLDGFSIEPTRFPSGIETIDNAPGFGFLSGILAFVSYSGYNVNTPGTPGHVFELIRVGGLGTTGAFFFDISYNLPDFPITDLVQDVASSLAPDGLVLYAASDFGVMRIPDNGSLTWTVAGSGLPMVEVSHLTIDIPARQLYGATHGLSAWIFGLQ